jgi:ParB-like chromosome segregation protein Spo0J
MFRPLTVQRVTLAPDNGARGPHEIDPGKVQRYAAAMRRGDVFPPVRLVDYDGSFMIVDGHHRTAAARAAGVPLAALSCAGAEFETLDCDLRCDPDAGRADDERYWPAPA